MGVFWATGLRTVIGGEDKNRIVVLPSHLEIGHQAANVKIHRLYHAAIHGHALGFEAAPLIIQRIPVPGSRHAHCAHTLFYNA